MIPEPQSAFGTTLTEETSPHAHAKVPLKSQKLSQCSDYYFGSKRSQRACKGILVSTSTTVGVKIHMYISYSQLKCFQPVTGCFLDMTYISPLFYQNHHMDELFLLTHLNFYHQNPYTITHILLILGRWSLAPVHTEFSYYSLIS